ncbi:hypothetical protein QQ045_003569 [Rhodiola kirilowii]
MPSSSRATADLNMDVDDFLHPETIDTSLLTMQSVHQTEAIRRMRFLPWSQVSNVKIDPRLCTALVERWRPKTHTFHLNRGEATITLHDMALLTGLPIDGEPVFGLAEGE